MPRFSHLTRLALAMGAALWSAGPGLSGPVDRATATAQMFSPRGSSVEITPFDWLDRDTARALEAQARSFDWYAAFAVSPGDPAANLSAMAAANFHTPEAAVAAALAGCEARRTTGAPCVVVARVLPRRHTPRALSLSRAATEALRGPYADLPLPRGLAISPATGAFGQASPPEAALARCAAEAARRGGGDDCVLVVRDPAD